MSHVLPLNPTGSAAGRYRRIVVVVAALVCVAVWVTALTILSLYERRGREQLASDLVVITESTTEYVTTLLADQRAQAAGMAGLPGVFDAVAALVFADSTSRLDEARDLLDAASHFGTSIIGYELMAPDGRLLATNLPAPISSDAPFPWEAGAEILLAPTTGEGIDDIRIRVWAPVVARNGRVVGHLGLSSDVGPVARLLSAALGTSASSDIYLFDDDGHLITPSRFEADLPALGLLEPGASSIGLRVTDPGRDLRAGGAADPDPPLTRLVASAISGNNGVDVDGYRDYRGVTVVGAWSWIDGLEVGLASEVDQAEAFAVFTSTRLLWVVAAGALTALTVLLAGTVVVTTRRLDRTTSALRVLSEGLEREVESRTEELTASRALLLAEAAAKDDLIAAVSHELRTPLSSVIGFASLGLESKTLDREARDLLETILSEGDDMADIVDDLTAVSRLSTNALHLDTSEIDVIAEARRVVDHWDPSQANRISVVGTSVIAVGDPARTRQVIRNLLTNAVRYGGPTVGVTVASEAGSVNLTVADDGLPIAPEVAARMFDPYFRGQSTGPAPSMGIGLGLSRGLAAAMGGSLTFRRVDDRNTFTLSLPAVTPPVVSRPSAGSHVDR